MSFVIKAKTFDKSFKKENFVSIAIVSSNINEVIRAISELQSTKRLQANKDKKYS